jgi:aspartate carbamoyltransferase regulatory subunit
LKLNLEHIIQQVFIPNDITTDDDENPITRETTKCSYCNINISKEFINTHIEMTHYSKTVPIIEEPSESCEFTGTPLKAFKEALEFSNEVIQEIDGGIFKKKESKRRPNFNYTKLKCDYCRREISKNQMRPHIKAKHYEKWNALYGTNQ